MNEHLKMIMSPYQLYQFFTPKKPQVVWFAPPGVAKGLLAAFASPGPTGDLGDKGALGSGPVARTGRANDKIKEDQKGKGRDQHETRERKKKDRNVT